VIRALAELPEPDRLALALRYFADLSDAEAAVIAGTSPGTFRVRLVRARRRLQKRLEEAE
jgi:RNA polymerase sigma-70 factor (ECF subfamily)